mmetsp:Transcript_17533/g.42541  ORF Transcript_17533/g.42541 Transcript_17533/m.42541 type:complete len:627 (+) Transcript_17533:155-2035(+)
MAGSWRTSFSLLIVASALFIAEGCDKGVCHDYGHEPRFDASHRPPSASVLGRATWTMLHTTAAYLPDNLDDSHKQSFKDVIHACATLYPGKGQALIQHIVSDPIVVKEIDAMKTSDDAALVVWKIHNAVTAYVWPERAAFPDSLGVKPVKFQVGDGSTSQFQLLGLNPNLRKQILDAVKARWVLTGGLEVKHWDKRDLLNLPPDRTMLGRAYWTYLHTISVYMAHHPSPEELAAFRSIFNAIYEIFPCPVCRGHFRLFFHDPILQKELEEISTKHGAILFVWKLHNVVTADGMNRGEWPNRHLFPSEKHLNVSQFLIPSPKSAHDQMKLLPCKHTSYDCFSKKDGFMVIADVQSRWQIEGGIDQPLTDAAPAACDPPKPEQKVLKMDMYVMGKCPWCAESLEHIADWIKCDYTCTYEGKTMTARLQFNLHMVGLNNGTYDQPWLRAIHGPSELVGERLELCARQHYAKDYQYIKFMKCMDKNVSTIPIRAPECAAKAEMDLDLLVACANMNGEQLVAGSYGYSSWMGIEITPTFVINSHKKIVGLPKNFTDEVCSQIALTSTSLAEVSAHSGVFHPDVQVSEAPLVMSGIAVLFGFTVCIGAPFFVLMTLRRRARGERRSLLRSDA